MPIAGSRAEDATDYYYYSIIPTLLTKLNLTHFV